MDAEGLVTDALVDLPDRVHKLERKLFEHDVILTWLLSRSGLDESRIQRAFALAAETVDHVFEVRADQAMQAWLATAEGKEAKRKADEAFRARQKELWREACREDGRIYPDPTAGP